MSRWPVVGSCRMDTTNCGLPRLALDDSCGAALALTGPWSVPCSTWAGAPSGALASDFSRSRMSRTCIVTRPLARGAHDKLGLDEDRPYLEGSTLRVVAVGGGDAHEAAAHQVPGLAACHVQARPHQHTTPRSFTYLHTLASSSPVPSCSPCRVAACPPVP